MACLRGLCYAPRDKHGARIEGLLHNCPAQFPAHPLYRPGGVCGRSHFPVPVTEEIPWLVRAIGLSLGGLKSEPEPPSDPVKLQALADKYIANATNRVPLPARVVPSTRQTTLGWTGDNGEVLIAAYVNDLEEGSDYPVGGSVVGQGADDEGHWEGWEELGDGTARSDHTIEWKTFPGGQLQRGCLRVGELSIPYLPYQFLVFEQGGRCPNGARAGNKNCLLSTLGMIQERSFRSMAMTLR